MNLRIIYTCPYYRLQVEKPLGIFYYWDTVYYSPTLEEVEAEYLKIISVG